MTIDQLRFFLAVADAQSFSGAAENLHISQSSVSKAIISLENELGTALFLRSQKVTELTTAGRFLYPDAVELEARYTDFVRRAKALSGKHGTQIHIITYPFMTQYGIQELFDAFERAHPGVRIRLEEPSDSAVVPMLTNNLCDFAIVRNTRVYAPEFDGIPLARDRISVFAHPDSWIASRPSVSIADLRQEKLLFMHEGLPIHQICLHACREAGFTPNIVHTARIETLLGFVRNRAGSALLAESIGRVFNLDWITSVPLVPALNCDAVLTWKRDHSLSGAQKLLLDFLGQQLCRDSSSL